MANQAFVDYQLDVKYSTPGAGVECGAWPYLVEVMASDEKPRMQAHLGLANGAMVPGFVISDGLGAGLGW